ncbi:MAG: response regulator, partial [Candidatus Rokuibacteriota bacterium]
MSSTPSGDAPRVLVADDHEDAVYIYEQFLSHHGLRVASAGDGYEALRKVSELAPDVILLDLSMPKLDGWETCRRLKADEQLRHIPVIVVSAHAFKPAEDQARAAGCDVYLTKPVGLD